MEVDREILEAQDKVAEKTQIYVPYNILPLDPDSANQAIMKYPEIQAAVAMFGFQKDNVANQREHLILLLANVHIRRFPKPDQPPKLDDQALTEVMKKLFKNYKKWCKFLDRKSSLWLPDTQQEPAYGGEEEAFLRKVVTPIYQVIAKEAERSKRGRSKHSQWRNYDDLNEYFWSDDCFGLGWPMSADADFFHLPAAEEPQQFEKTEDSKPAYRDRWVGKVNFVEIRSFWHIFRSYDRMWSFFILSLQAMIIVAWNGSGDPTALFTPDVFKKLLSIFITAAIMELGQAVLDVILSWKSQRSMSNFVKLRYILKVVSGLLLGLLFCQ
ncbi:hypothetical protein NL676_004382 [Syzygium grande]|nr:hypothetical protein NL676_004382 [Syzygium grande]